MPPKAGRKLSDRVTQSSDKLIVVPYRPKRKLWILAMLVVGYGCVASFSYFGGQIMALRHGETKFSVDRKSASQLRVLEEEVSKLKEQVAIHKQHVIVEQKAVEMVRKENIDLQGQISDLEEHVAYYQRVVKPDTKDRGLLIGELELEPTTVESRYRYSFHVVQVSGSNRVGGFVNLKLIGFELTKRREYELAELNSNVAIRGERVGFRNFQVVSGELILPVGFVPTKVEISADIVEGKKVKLRRVFEWRVKESVVDVEKTEEKS